MRRVTERGGGVWRALYYGGASNKWMIFEEFCLGGIYGDGYGYGYGYGVWIWVWIHVKPGEKDVFRKEMDLIFPLLARADK